MGQEVEKLVQRLEEAEGMNCGCTYLGVYGDAAEALRRAEAQVEALRKVILVTRGLVAEGCDSGFTDHDWMERLFLNQAALTAALSAPAEENSSSRDLSHAAGSALDGLADYLHDQALLADSEANQRVGGQRNRLLQEAKDCRAWAAALASSTPESGFQLAEPVAWRCRYGAYGAWIPTIHQKTVEARRRQGGWEIEPLYTVAPALESSVEASAGAEKLVVDAFIAGLEFATGHPSARGAYTMQRAKAYARAALPQAEDFSCI